jgi:anti-anti-sigma regulatory factor
MNDLLRTSRPLNDSLAILTAPTEVDIKNAGQLLCSLMSAAGSASIVVLDMTATTVCDTWGFLAMTLAGDQARAEGGNLRIACSDRLRRLSSINRDDEHFSVFSTMTEAEVANPVLHPEPGLAPAV